MLVAKFQNLISNIQTTHEYFSAQTRSTINQYLTLRNWLIGYYIVEFEQKGEDRADYGDHLIESLASRLKEIKGIDRRSLFRFRQLYILYPQIYYVVQELLQSDNQSLMKVGTVSPLLPSAFVGTASPQLRPDLESEPNTLVTTLSYSHLELLITIEDPLKRAYYEIESIKGIWSVRELKRQINSLSYERSAASSNPKLMSQSFRNKSGRQTAKDLIKNPYVFDFLGLPDEILGSESKLEKALIHNLKTFILELGHGFCFEAQQKRIVIGGEYYFIDLVFYHRILKCHILIELKIEAFNHINAGQLNTYVQFYKDNMMEEADNPPIGILLCTNKNDELVKYALGGMDENIFVSQYQTQLPSTTQLEKFLKQEKDKLASL